MQAESEISVQDGEIKVISGKLSKEKASSSLMKGLQKKFQTSQKYTTVRRANKKKKNISLVTSNLTLSQDYPELLWESVGEEYAYKIHVGEQILDVPASDAGVVRFKMQPVTEKKSSYTIDVLKGNKVVASSNPKEILWMGENEQSQVRQQVKLIQEMDSEGFLLGNYLEEQGLLVPALEQYVTFFDVNADDPEVNEVRPLLIQLYAKLKLNTLRREEVKQYNAIKFEANE